MRKKIAILLAVVLMISIVCFSGCGKTKSAEEAVDKNVNAAETEQQDSNNPIATIKMKDGGAIEVELYAKQVPNTVKNFIALSNSGFYDGLTFHRVINGFMIQGGDPDGNGTGGPGYSIDGEFSSNNFDNPIKHDRGVISMARSGDPNSAGSQFFICHKTAEHLDGDYAAFGKVINGMEVVDDIASRKTDSNDKPITDVVIESIRVDTKGVDYGEPVTQ